MAFFFVSCQAKRLSRSSPRKVSRLTVELNCLLVDSQLYSLYFVTRRTGLINSVWMFFLGVVEKVQIKARCVMRRSVTRPVLVVAATRPDWPLKIARRRLHRVPATRECCALLNKYGIFIFFAETHKLWQMSRDTLPRIAALPAVTMGSYIR